MTETDYAQQLSVVVLAGGEGRRMGGQDKGLIPYRGRPMIEHVLGNIPDDVARILISANRNLDTYGRYAQVVRDAGPGYAGPLAGILAAMENVQTPYLMVLPCDTPKLPQDLLTRLHAAMVKEDADVAIACSDERCHYVIVMLKTTLQQKLRDYLAGDQHRVGQWLRSQRFTEVYFDADDGNFGNLNDPEALIE